MKLLSKTLLATLLTLGIAACGAGESADTTSSEIVDVVAAMPNSSPKTVQDDYDGTITKPSSPYSISYRIIGTPLVGSPVVIDLRVKSSLGLSPVNLTYRINDATAMVLAESQPASIYMEPADNERSLSQQVTVIPQREGRLYLNVSAAFETEEGTISTVMAIPVQVGTGSRELQEHGTVELDENGEAVRVLSGD